MISDKLDKVPQPLRLLPALIALLIIYFIVEDREVSYTISKFKYHVLLLMILALAFLVTLRYNLVSRLRYNHLLKGAVRDNVDKEIYFKAYRLYALNKDNKNVSDELTKIIKNRASRGLVSYLVLSYLSNKGMGTMLVLISDNSLSVEMESEVFLTMLTSLNLARVEEINVDKQILENLYKLFSSVRFRNSDLIPIPVESRIILERKGFSFDVPLGETLDTPTPIKVGLTASDIASHVAIFGSTGSGKSTTSAILACGVWSRLKVPVHIMDWTGEYELLLKKVGCRSNIKIVNPLKEGPIIDPFKLGIISSDTVSEVLGKALGLSWPQVYMLGNVLEEHTPSSIKELIELVESLEEESSWDREVKRGLLRRIGILIRGQGAEIFKNSSYNPIDFGSEGIVVFDLSNIKLSLLRRAYVLLYLSSMFVHRLEKRVHPNPVFVIVDEAHNVFDPSEIPFTDNLVAESRKLGLWLGIVTQSPSSVSNATLLNTNTKIIHAVRSARDKLIITETMNLRKDYVEALDRLSVGQALLSAPSLGEPVLIQVELL